MWMDSKHTPNDIPHQLTARWVLDVRGAQAALNLSPSFGKSHNRINMSRLKFFESRDVKLGEADTALEPLLGHDGGMHYEIKCICNAQTHKKVRKLWVEWQGYDQLQNGWVSRESLMHDVPALVWVFKQNPSHFQPRALAPKCVPGVLKLVMVVRKSVTVGPSQVLISSVSGPGIVVQSKTPV